ncbi:GntR family transcriptional regulator [Pseudaminobacter salicylatoxidans]|uniref:GntR family transcriptional regulator n=1 Tax=Pseudaminobacter salicylatoxidans TaxID=93369 RepID=UPI0018E098B3|nr:GntR family transcriptional regulator [Pseudaminobacter salicylatoxidans]
MGKPPKSQPLTEQAYTHLKWLILNQEIPAGTLLNEQALVEATGFGRASVHHALHRLAYDDLVVIRPRKGAQVRLWSDKDIHALVEARLPVEQTIVRLACARISDAAVEEIRKELETTPRLIEEMDREGLLRLDLWFHAAIAQATANPILADTALRLHQRSTQFWAPSLSGRDRYYKVYEQHSEILDAIGERDTERADRAISLHINNFAEKTI